MIEGEGNTVRLYTPDTKLVQVLQKSYAVGING